MNEEINATNEEVIRAFYLWYMDVIINLETYDLDEVTLENVIKYAEEAAKDFQNFLQKAKNYG